LALTGIDDLFYRNIVLMLKPDLFLQQLEEQVKRQTRRELNHVCEYIQAHLASTLTLSELEKNSGLSVWRWNCHCPSLWRIS